jgi:Sulfotransferase family
LTAPWAPVFVVGVSRSGTNLLRAIFNKHSEIWVPSETHYFDDLRPRLGDGAKGRLSKRAQEEVERYFLALGHRPYGWGGDPAESAISQEELRALAAERGATGDAYFWSFCTIRARQHGKSRWAEKTPRHVYRIDDIFSAFPDAKIVCLIRDPRAVAASYRDWHLAKKRNADPNRLQRSADVERARRSYNIVLMSLLWRGVVHNSYAALRKHGMDRVRVVRFESLVLRPAETLRELCQWLGIGYESEMMDVQLVNSSYSAASEHPSGISTDAVDRWRSKLSPVEVAVIQRCCRGFMDELQYEMLPVEISRLRFAWRFASVVPAAVRATLANRARFGRALDYVLRRAAPALSRSSLPQGAAGTSRPG